MPGIPEPSQFSNEILQAVVRIILYHFDHCISSPETTILSLIRSQHTAEPADIRPASQRHSRTGERVVGGKTTQPGLSATDLRQVHPALTRKPSPAKLTRLARAGPVPDDVRSKIVKATSISPGNSAAVFQPYIANPVERISARKKREQSVSLTLIPDLDKSRANLCRGEGRVLSKAKGRAWVNQPP